MSDDMKRPAVDLSPSVRSVLPSFASKGSIAMTRFPLWRSLAATVLLVAVIVLLRAPIGNAARYHETRSPSSCDVTMTGGGMGQDDSHRGTPGTGMGRDDARMGTPGGGMDRDDSHMESRDGDKPCDDSHRGSPVARTDCRNMMGSPVAGMGRDANRIATPGDHMDCANRDGTPSPGMGCDGMNGSPTVGRDCDGMASDSD